MRKLEKLDFYRKSLGPVDSSPGLIFSKHMKFNLNYLAELDRSRTMNLQERILLGVFLIAHSGLRMLCNSPDMLTQWKFDSGGA